MEQKIVEAIPIRDQVVEIIREMILNGELKPEQQLSERQLGRELHVSTTPIKEAFRILQSEGLLYSVPRKGSFVSEFSKRNVLQTVYIRGAMEGVAAYFACQNITDYGKGINSLRQIYFAKKDRF
jgi:DNA-binding GntR family transcriptional regulator